MQATDLIGLGDDPALDFLNSTATPARGTIELIGDGASYVRWLEQAGLIERADVTAILRKFAPSELDEVANQAVELRRWLRPIVVGWATPPVGTLPVSATTRLNAILQNDRRFAQLRRTPDSSFAHRLVDRRPWDDIRQVLAPPAAAAARLLTSADPELVRNCEGPGCTLLFYDRTKSHRRRWCSMAVCGNRAKARAHRERIRG